MRGETHGVVVRTFAKQLHKFHPSPRPSPTRGEGVKIKNPHPGAPIAQRHASATGSSLSRGRGLCSTAGRLPTFSSGRPIPSQACRGGIRSITKSLSRCACTAQQARASAGATSAGNRRNAANSSLNRRVFLVRNLEPVTGIEPATARSLTWCSVQLSYTIGQRSFRTWSRNARRKARGAPPALRRTVSIVCPCGRIPKIKRPRR